MRASATRLARSRPTASTCAGRPTRKDAPEVARDIRRFEKSLAARGVQQLTVLSQPVAATVLIDGRPVGVTPFTDELDPGPHTLELRLRGFVSAIRGFDLPNDAAQEIEVALRAEQVEPAARRLRQSRARPHRRRRSCRPCSSPANRRPRPRASSPRSRGSSCAGRPRSMTRLARPRCSAGSLRAARAAALGGALAFELLRSAEENRARNAATQIEFAERLDTMQTQQTAARVLAGVGGGLSVIGVLLPIAGATEGGPSEGQHSESQVTAQLTFGRGGAGAKLWARY